MYNDNNENTSVPTAIISPDPEKIIILMEFLKLTVAGLVENKDEICVNVIKTDKTEKNGLPYLSLGLSVAPDEIGRIIGKQGRIAKALRIVLSSAAQFHGISVNLSIS